MIRHRKIGLARAIVVTMLMFAAVPASRAATTLMSADWAGQACAAWNEEPTLTEELMQSGWAANDNGRGYKIIQLFRADCDQTPHAQLRIGAEDGKAMCTYGGAVEQEPDLEVDYIMYASTVRWQEMGRGEYGPMRGMLFGRLKFEGPKWEAMKNMGPFGSFLLLVGKVPSESASCP